MVLGKNQRILTDEAKSERREQLRKWLIAENNKLIKTRYTCPVSGNPCRGKNCALFKVDSKCQEPKEKCSLTDGLAAEGMHETKGLLCPVSGFERVCQPTCAFYRDGCRLTNNRQENDGV